MIITQTPLRISFFGGGTDYPEYYRVSGGETLAASINQYTTVTVHPLTQFVDYSVRVHYSQLETVKEISEIEHTTARECMRLLGIPGGIEIYYSDDLPARTGLGSSSAATVGLLHALHTLKGESVSQEQLAVEAVRVEQEMVKDRVGSQDQYICALGGFRHLQFHQDGTIETSLVSVAPERLHALQERLMLVYTGKQRNAHDVLDEQQERTQAGKNDAHLAGMKKLVARGIDVLKGSGDLGEFGFLLHEGWELKRKLSNKVTTAQVDEFYERARAAGASGGKLLGAGGGGFLLLFAEPEMRARVKDALSELNEAPFAFERGGSQLVFHRPHRRL
ncbi:MAG: kinase [bacterium]|nr:kinase [bacterium]